jgi:hypothetical protein
MNLDSKHPIGIGTYMYRSTLGLLRDHPPHLAALVCIGLDGTYTNILASENRSSSIHMQVATSYFVDRKGGSRTVRGTCVVVLHAGEFPAINSTPNCKAFHLQEAAIRKDMMPA